MLSIATVSLATTLCLLALATSASAECAWVLWVEESWNVALKKDERPKQWTLVEAFGTQADCNKAQSEKVTTLAGSKGSQVRANIVNKEFPTGYPADTVEGIPHTRLLRVLCVPDTIDPRGPKGK